MKRVAGILFLCLAGALPAGAVAASELIYRPINPSFGGNPNMSSHLINLAQLQNKHAASGGGGGGGIPQINFPPITIDLGGIGGGGGGNGNGNGNGGNDNGGNGGNGNGGNGNGNPVTEGFALNNGAERVNASN